MTLTERISEVLAKAPRLKLGVWPTPFIPMNGLRKSLEDEGATCPALWVKREDMTPLGAGGNKIRKLEHVLEAALREKADVLLNTGEVQSNQVVQTAAAAAHLGIDCELFLGRTDPPLSDDDQKTGNILLCRILGAKIHMVAPGANRAEAMRARAAQLKEEGRNPYVIPRGSSTFEGSLGSLRCFNELLGQARERGFTPDGIVLTVGSAGSCAGFLAGATALARSGGPAISIYAFDSFGEDYPVKAHERIMEHAEECWAKLGLPGHCGEDLLHLSYDFVGPGYSRPYPEMIATVRRVARTEGLILDPNYTGKCVTGMLSAIRNGVFPEHANVVYLHTGGLPALFAMHHYFNEE